MPSARSIEILLPCPFCGKKVETFHNGLELWSINCLPCEVHMGLNERGFYTEREVIEAWNKRTSLG